ncbi:MAG: UbiD family decarboxylase, partial [Candidatus Korarchaeota archaeon]|nr:UbiD family decarboxylase [Candidatus Korarchaeota archaeon]
MDLRLALKRLEERDLLHVIDKETSVEYEIAAHLKKWDGRKAVLFKNPLLVDGRRSAFRVVGGVATSRETLLTSFSISDMREMRSRIRRALKNPILPVEGGPEWVRAGITLSELPILKHYIGEPGPYMTASIVVFKDEDGLFSSSYHRMMPIGDKKLVLRAVEGRKLSRTIERFSEKGEDLPAAISIGSPLEVMLASAVPAESMDKIALAGGIAREPVSISQCEGVEAWAPSRSEIVICGKILAKERAFEGPFYEILGKDIVRQQPVFEVEEIYAMPDGFYQAILPAGSEHQLLMGLPVEPLIEDRVSEVADVVDVAMTP